ncbi:hypothetical protein BE08_10645 [Sorangium cellulosum]|uniref:Uncharacterized protein n=1 Tax=Sorangium cellulosum TaxID=56 RepID=A0A150PL66_SORCE|nr:hypothetical protein BE08_10645 [Sorangium cellulosum]
MSRMRGALGRSKPARRSTAMIAERASSRSPAASPRRSWRASGIVARGRTTCTGLVTPSQTKPVRRMGCRSASACQARSKASRSSRPSSRKAVCTKYGSADRSETA